ncbi:hypothetical protein AAGW04_18215 [Pectobacterium aroidearum]|uniref:hypothetical protein n=1 Tax=Pectobacterium aroidearum TaxID=1201031 RepID=UPI0031594E1C
MMVDKGKLMGSVKKDRKAKCGHLNRGFFVLTVIYTLWFLYFVLGGAVGWVWNPINILTLQAAGLHGTVQGAWESFSFLGNAKEKFNALFSLMVIFILVFFQIAVFTKAMVAVQDRWLRKVIFWITDDRVIARYYAVMLCKRDAGSLL